jgi:hypothetical protein
MNSLISTSGALMFLVSSAFAGDRIESSDSWSETFEVSKSSPALEISNIWGDIRVLPGKKGEITVSIKEHRSAPDQARYDRSLETLKLRTETSDEGVSMYVGNRNRDWRGNNTCRGCQVDYQFEVRVPVDTRLDVSTVNDGRIEVEGISGIVNASNVNGPISIAQLRNCHTLNSVNGAVSLSFTHPPGEDCNIETINGDITLKVPNDTGLDVAMDLFNGRMRSELPVDPMAIPATVKHTQSNGRHQYQIDQPAGVRIAGGGPTFTISSINGDIRIQKTQ